MAFTTTRTREELFIERMEEYIRDNFPTLTNFKIQMSDREQMNAMEIRLYDFDKKPAKVYVQMVNRMDMLQDSMLGYILQQCAAELGHRAANPPPVLNFRQPNIPLLKRMLDQI